MAPSDNQSDGYLQLNPNVKRRRNTESMSNVTSLKDKLTSHLRKKRYENSLVPVSAAFIEVKINDIEQRLL